MSIRHRHGRARPPRLRTPVRWLAVTAVLGALACVGLAAVRSRTASDNLGAGLDAYARGDWTAAARVARRRLVGTPGDPAALKLLARSSVKLGLEPSARLLYQQLGSGAMDADDFYLLGHALRRTGNERGIKVWEKSLRQHADHAETLDALSRFYFEGGRFHAASRLALRLADQPTWRTRASRLLGQVEFARNDFGAAIDHWRRSLDARPSPGDPGVRDEPAVRKDLARALLHAGRAAEALSELRSVLANGPDAEASWLLSRACLQENALPEARAALKEAGSFVEEDPARPEPAPFTGAASCAPCHAAKYQAQQGSHHAGTFHRADEPEVLALPGADLADPANPRVAHRLERVDGRLRHETRTPGRLYQAVIDYAFGSGDRGKTPVGHDPSGEQFERLSVYHERSAGAAPGTSPAATTSIRGPTATSSACP
ncbi:MAG: tetratricopeptide repeat protein [Isosphaeraceae bacterium]